MGRLGEPGTLAPSLTQLVLRGPTISLYDWLGMRLLRQDSFEHGQVLRCLWQSGLLALTAMTLVILMSTTTPFEDFDHWTYDFVVVHAGLKEPGRQIVLVDFDDATFAKYPRYPLPRTLVAQVVERVGEQKPRVAGMDILLSEPRTPEEDQALQQALTKAGMFLVASQDGDGGIPPEMPLPMFCQPEEPGLVSGFCKDSAETPGAMGYASINLPLDADGFVRQGLLFGGKTPAPSFAVMMAAQYSGESIKPVDAKRFSFLGKTLYYSNHQAGEILIGSWAHRPVPIVPAWQVLEGTVPPGTFTDKLVLMGQSSDAARDFHYTPLYRYADANGVRRPTAGTQVLGAVIRTLLEGTAVRLTPQWLRWTAVLLMCWIASFVILYLRTAIGMGIMVGIVIIPVLVALLLYAKGRFWLHFLGQEIGLVITLPLTLFVQFLSERVLAQEARSQRMQLMTLFNSYVDPAVAGTIWDRRNEVSLNGEERIATVMFTDIRSFTALSAGKPPAQVLQWLNQYMTAMDEVIRLHGGFLNKFIGDGLMIIFGLPLSHGVRQDAQRGVHAALAMLKRVDQLNFENLKHPERPQLRIGVGIHTGPLMAGSIGSAKRQEYSVIGETVNLASRLESLNKPYKTEILMSQATHDILTEDFIGFEALGEAQVAGFDQPIPIFTLRGQIRGR